MKAEVLESTRSQRGRSQLKCTIVRKVERGGKDEQQAQRAERKNKNEQERSESRSSQLSLEQVERTRCRVNSLLHQNQQTPSHRIPPPNRIQLPFLSHSSPTSPPASPSSSRSHHPARSSSGLPTTIRQSFQTQKPSQGRTVVSGDFLQCPTCEGGEGRRDDSSTGETGEGVAGEIEGFVGESWRRRGGIGRWGTSIFCFG